MTYLNAAASKHVTFTLLDGPKDKWRHAEQSNSFMSFFDLWVWMGSRGRQGVARLVRVNSDDSAADTYYEDSLYMFIFG